MNTLTEKQNLRYDLLKANNYDVQNSKACYDFIAGNETATPEPQQAKTANGLADGVYLMRKNSAPELFIGQTVDVLSHKYYDGVGVKLGGKSLVVALGDITENEITLTKKQGGTRFTDKYDEAVANWSGKENTNDIRDILNDAILLEGGEYIPSLGELYFILLHLRRINAALKSIGGEPLCGWYWSSTQYSATNAWYLYLGDGFAGYGGPKAAGQGRVRAVSAFLPLNS